ncbi:MAG: two-component system response regulator OmpR [Candidatus Nitrotoga sp.]|nr:two-component system response regulator OmpR [Candidatus Nitrotoga sp.]MDO9448647.1 two-component system response regulator OmpR [Candidatus Nitrotoga sp.]MDP3497234.1 two-component system response regulator OmpR [Candidatus Nitrotoga sp.]
MDNMHRILIIDDDSRLRSLLLRYLGEQGFTVKAAIDGSEMDKALALNRYHLLVLDLMLPNEDGLSILRRLRGAGENVPVILLTAKGDEIDRIIGLEMGADDYLPKPFNPRELVARIHAILRRKGTQPVGAPQTEEKIITFGVYELNLATRALSKSGVPIALTTGEFALLKTLVTHPRHPLSRDKLMELARGRNHDPFDRAIDVQISRLRKLIEADLAHPRFIQTVWGHGYVFVPDGITP